jgi:hypothetical protein
LSLAMMHSKQLLGTVNKIHKDLEMLNEKISIYDKEVSKIYHLIEVTKLTPDEGFNISLKLQEVLRLRRKTKYEISRIKYLIKSIDSDSLKQQVVQTKQNMKKYEIEYVAEFPLYQDIISVDYDKLCGDVI